jgi:hypothetical protein
LIRHGLHGERKELGGFTDRNADTWTQTNGEQVDLISLLTQIREGNTDRRAERQQNDFITLLIKIRVTQTERQIGEVISLLLLFQNMGIKLIIERYEITLLSLCLCTLPTPERRNGGTISDGRC